MSVMVNSELSPKFFNPYARLFGLLLEAHWIKLGIQQTHIAAKIGMAPAYLSQKKLADRFFSLGELLRVSRVLGVNCATLFDQMESLCTRLYQQKVRIPGWRATEMEEANSSTQLAASIAAKYPHKDKPISVGFVACGIMAASRNTEMDVWAELKISEASWRYKNYGENSLFLFDLINFEWRTGVSLSSLFQRLDEVCLDLSFNSSPVQGWIYTKDEDRMGDDQRVAQTLAYLLPSRGWLQGPLHPRDLGFGFPYKKTKKWSAINGK